MRMATLAGHKAIPLGQDLKGAVRVAELFPARRPTLAVVGVGGCARDGLAQAGNRVGGSVQCRAMPPPRMALASGSAGSKITASAASRAAPSTSPIRLPQIRPAFAQPGVGGSGRDAAVKFLAAPVPTHRCPRRRGQPIKVSSGDGGAERPRGGQ